MACAECPDCSLDDRPAAGPIHDVLRTHHELHVTVPVEGTADRRLDTLAEELGVRVHRMLLLVPNGTTQLDVMTGSSLRGTDEEARGALIGLGDRLALGGYEPLRVKIESSPWHHRASVGPDAELPDGCYWESHVGFWVLEPTAWKIAEELSSRGYVSQNLGRETRDDGCRRFVASLRRRSGNYAEALVDALALRDRLDRAGFEPSQPRVEFTWLDLAEEPRFGGPP